jgi:hypothetical protein
MKRRWLAFSLCISCIAYGNEDCRNVDSHAEQRECLEQLAALTAAEVSDAQIKMQKRITQYDDKAQIKNGILRRFLESTQQFSLYRTAQCEFEASSAAAGNGAGDLRLQCEIRLNRAYVSRLQEPLGML